MKAWLKQRADAISLDARLTAHLRAPLIAAALVRIGFAIATYARTGTRGMTQGDTYSYLIPGRSLILHGAFSSAGLPEIDRTPGYPIFAELSGMIWNNVLLTVAIQILVSLVSLLLIARIADHIFSNTKARTLAAWLYAFEPLSIVYTSRLMPETLFVLLLLLVIERILAFRSSEKLQPLFIAGLLLASATYVRPVSCYLVFPLAAGLAVTAGKRRGLWWKAPLILLLSTLPCLAAWQLRNSLETGYRGFSSIVEKNLYFFQSAEVTAKVLDISLQTEQKDLGYPEDTYYATAHPEQLAWSEAQKLAYMRAHALEILSAHRALYLKTHFAGVGVVAFTPCAAELLQLLGLYPPSDAMPHRVVSEGVVTSALRIFASHPGVAAAMAMLETFLLALYALALWGCRNAGLRNTPMWTLAGIAFYFLLISGGAQAVGRYRVPVMPLLCVLAAGSMTAFNPKKSGAMTAPLV